MLNTGGKNYYVTIKNFTHGNLVLDDGCDKIDDEAMRLIQNRSNLEKMIFCFLVLEEWEIVYWLITSRITGISMSLFSH